MKHEISMTPKDRESETKDEIYRFEFTMINVLQKLRV